MLSATAINARKHTLWIMVGIYCLVAAIASISSNDITCITNLNQSAWVQANHATIKWLSNDLMFCFYLLFLGLLLLAWRQKKVALKQICQAYFLTQLIGSVFIVGILKRLLGHARPSQFIHHGLSAEDAWIGPTLNVHYFGFPSGHTCDYLISCIFVALLLPKRWMQVLAISLAMLEGFFRLTLAKHLPIDVLGGAIVATLTSYGVIQYWLLPRLQQQLRG